MLLPGFWHVTPLMGRKVTKNYSYRKEIHAHSPLVKEQMD